MYNYDPYQEYMAQTPMAATPYLPYDGGQGGGTAVAPTAPASPAPAPTPPQVDIGSTLDDMQHWAGPTEVTHKGAFGIHGTLRDILGYLGDALTGKSIYRNTRDQERKSDALQGFQEDPGSSIDRMVQVDPAFANQLHNQYASQAEREAAARTAAARAEAARAQINQRIEDGILSRAAGMISLANRTTLKDGTVDPENLARVRTAVTNLLTAKGINLPEGVSVDDLPGYATAPKDQAMEDYRGDMMDYRSNVLDERRGYHQGVLKQGDRRLDQGDTRLQQGDRRLDQGDTRLQQGQEGLDQRGKHYSNIDANAATRTSWGPSGRRRGVASTPTVSGPNDPVYQHLPSGALYLRPGSTTPYRKK